ncbi:MAG: hypothetical protein AAF806_25570 [Bacteroidota bacterium]
MGKITRLLEDIWRTSSIILNGSDIDRDFLDEHYKLIRYTIPEDFHFHTADRSWKFRSLHTAYKEQINKPYYFNTRSLKLFVLYQPNDRTLDFILDFLKNSKCESREFPFEWIYPSDLLKLFMSDYFYNEIEAARRICQSHYFVIGEKTTNFATALKLSLSRNYGTENEFFVKNAAKKFVKCSREDKDNSYQRYEIVTFNGTSYFRQLRQSKIKECPNDIWREQKTDKSNRAKAPFYHDQKLEISRCYTLFQFQNHFQEYLSNVGIKIQSKSDKWKWKSNNYKFDEEGYGTSGLPLKQLKTIRVYDNRLRNRETKEVINEQVTLKEYIDLLEDFSKDKKHNFGLSFKAIDYKEITKADFDEPLLLIQDVTGEEFKERESTDEPDEEGAKKQTQEFHLLKELGYKDPKNQFYIEEFSHIPKQSLTVNINKYDYKEYLDKYKTYLDYPIFYSEKDNEKYEKGSEDAKQAKVQNEEADRFINKIKVCLNELFLKNMLIKNIPIDRIEADLFTPNYKFPCSPLGTEMQDFLFIHKGYLMYVEDKCFKFINRIENKTAFVQRIKKLKYKWKEITGKFKDDNYLREPDNNETEADFYEKVEKRLNSAYFIITPTHVIEIVQLEEYLLPKIDRILEEKERRSGDNPSVRGQDFIGCLMELNYNDQNFEYAVGVRGGARTKIDKGNPIRQLKFYEGNPTDFNFELFLDSLLVRFVRNEKYTVYPYPFDLIKLYFEIKDW